MFIVDKFPIWAVYIIMMALVLVMIVLRLSQTIQTLGIYYSNISYVLLVSGELHIHSISIPDETTHEDISMELESACNF